MLLDASPGFRVLLIPLIGCFIHTAAASCRCLAGGKQELCFPPFVPRQISKCLNATQLVLGGVACPTCCDELTGEFLRANLHSLHTVTARGDSYCCLVKLKHFELRLSPVCILSTVSRTSFSTTPFTTSSATSTASTVNSHASKTLSATSTTLSATSTTLSATSTTLSATSTTVRSSAAGSLDTTKLSTSEVTVSVPTSLPIPPTTGGATVFSNEITAEKPINKILVGSLTSLGLLGFGSLAVVVIYRKCKKTASPFPASDIELNDFSNSPTLPMRSFYDRLNATADTSIGSPAPCGSPAPFGSPEPHISQSPCGLLVEETGVKSVEKTKDVGEIEEAVVPVETFEKTHPRGKLGRFVKKK